MRIEGKALATPIDESEFGHLSTKRLVLLQYTIGLSAIERQLTDASYVDPALGYAVAVAVLALARASIFVAASLTGERAHWLKKLLSSPENFAIVSLNM